MGWATGTFDTDRMNLSWMDEIKKKKVEFEKKHMSEEEKFMENLKKQYGFDEETIVIIMKLKYGIDQEFLGLSQLGKDYLLNLLLGSFVYVDTETAMNSIKDHLTATAWLNTAGSLQDKMKKLSELSSYTDLGLSEEEYRYLRYKIRIQNAIVSSPDSNSLKYIKTNNLYEQYKKMMEKTLARKLSDQEFEKIWNEQYNSMIGKGDLAHQSITQATILNPDFAWSSLLGGKKILKTYQVGKVIQQTRFLEILV